MISNAVRMAGNVLCWLVLALVVLVFEPARMFVERIYARVVTAGFGEGPHTPTQWVSSVLLAIVLVGGTAFGFFWALVRLV